MIRGAGPRGPPPPSVKCESNAGLDMKAVLDRAGDAYKVLLASTLGTMVTIVFVNVVLRKFFHSGISFTEEALRYLFVWMSYLGIVAAYKSNSHIRVTLLVDLLPPKGKAALSAAMNLIMLYGLWFCLDGAFVYIEANAGTYGELLKIPYYLVILSLVFACLGMGFLMLCELVQQAGLLLGREKR